MRNLRAGTTLVGLLIFCGCSVDTARSPAASPRPATTTRATAGDTSSRLRPDGPPGPDTAAVDAVPIVSQAALDTVRCATADTAAKDAGRAYIDSLEVVAFPSSNGKASRACGELRIRLLNGRTALFTDDTVPSPHFGLSRYAGYQQKIHSHIVHHYNYEGSGAWVVVDDSTGDSRIVFGQPVASPDGQRFVLTSMADEAGYDPGMIEIWRIVNRRPEKEFSYDTGEARWQASDPVWVDSSTIDFIKNTYTSMSEPDLESPGRIVRAGTTWTFAPDPVVAANPVGVWRGTSLCTRVGSSPCNDEMDVYRIARVAGGDSLSADGRRIANGQEVEMGVLGCHMRSVSQFKCPMPNGVWYFTVRGDSLLGELIMPDHSPYRRVRAARSR